MGQGRDRCRDNVAAPRIFDRHRNAQRHTHVTNLTCLREPADFRDLQVDHVHRLIGNGPHDHAEIIDHFVEYEWPICVAAYHQTLFVAEAGLLDVNIDVTHRVDDPN